jgi:hypothetical protein
VERYEFKKERVQPDKDFMPTYRINCVMCNEKRIWKMDLAKWTTNDQDVKIHPPIPRLCDNCQKIQCRKHKLEKINEEA